MPFAVRPRLSRRPSSSNSSAATSTSSTSTTPASTTPSSPTSSTLDLTRTPTLKLTKTSSSTSSRLSLFRTSSSSKTAAPKAPNWAKYAPKKFKFREPSPAHVAMLSAWDFSWSESDRRRRSVDEGISPCASRRGSYEDLREQFEHIEVA